MVEPVQPLNRRSDAEVANRENVLPIKVDEQKHVRRPAPKSARRRDLFANLVIRKLVQVVDLQLARDDVLGKRSDVLDLPSREPDPLGVGRVQGQQRRR